MAMIAVTRMVVTVIVGFITYLNTTATFITIFISIIIMVAIVILMSISIDTVKAAEATSP